MINRYSVSYKTVEMGYRSLQGEYKKYSLTAALLIKGTKKTKQGL